MKPLPPILICLGLVVGCAAERSAQPIAGSAVASAAPASRSEVALLRLVRLETQPELSFAIEERLEHYGVPGVSVAVIEGEEVAWAAAWGVVEAGATEPVTPETLFRACSLSKPVAAVAALAMAEEGAFSLAEDVNEHLVTWRVPETELTATEKVTVERILSHTAGVSVWGFSPYALDEPLPSLRQILDGEAPARDDPIRVEATPGSRMRYSGGGYTILEQLMIDVGGGPFDQIIAERVFEPIGMTSSTYENETVSTAGVAVGHDGLGRPIAGRFGAVPELAAAGLRTTPTELARVLVEILRANNGEGSSILSPESARNMLTARLDGAGLGLFLTGEGEDLMASHGATDSGYQAYLVAFPSRGEGAVVMTNGDRGGKLQQEILRGLAAEYGWPHFAQIERNDVAPDPAALARLVGRYDVPNAWSFTIEIDGEQLVFVEPDGYRAYLAAANETSFFDPDDGSQIIFRLDDSDDVVAVDIRTVRGEEASAVPASN